MVSNSAVCGVAEKVNSLADSAAIVFTAPDVDVSALLRGAVDAARRKHEAVGLEVGYQPSYWTRVYACERGITLDRLGRLPLDVQRAMVRGWAEALGMRIERRETKGRREAILALAQSARALAEMI